MNLPGSEGFLDFLGEQALAADFGQRPVWDAVAGRGDHDNFDVGFGKSMGGHEAGAGFPGLGKGQGRASGTDLQTGHLQVISGGC